MSARCQCRRTRLFHGAMVVVLVVCVRALGELFKSIRCGHSSSMEKHMWWRAKECGLGQASEGLYFVLVFFGSLMREAAKATSNLVTLGCLRRELPWSDR